MTDQLAQIHERIEQIEAEKLTAWRRLSGATTTTRELYVTYESASSAAKKAARSAQAEVERLRADDTMYPEGRKRLIAEAIAKGNAEVKKQRDRMETAIEVLKAHLSESAVPRLDKAREMPARDELRLILDGSPDPAVMMMQLAQRDDELGAVAASSYGESYLRGRGIPKAQEAAQSIRGVAAASAVRSADVQRRAIGEAFAQIGTLEQALACTNEIVRTALGAAQEGGREA